jgi:hypothetical protein
LKLDDDVVVVVVTRCERPRACRATGVILNVVLVLVVVG